MRNSKKIIIFLVGFPSWMVGMKHGEIKHHAEHVRHKEKSKSERATEFRTACNKAFKQVWNNKSQNKKKYKETLANQHDFQPDSSKTFDQYRFMLMKNAYINTLQEYYPSDPLLTETAHKKLDKQATEAARNYIDQFPCGGSCWLCCVGM